MSACGSVPQPFRPLESAKQHSDYLLAPDSLGVVVRRIEGPVGWVGDAFATAMAKSLRHRGIVAGSRWSNQRSLLLSASGYQQLHADQPPELVVTWTLADRDGVVKGVRETRAVPPDVFWEAPTAGMFHDIADQNADMVVAWINPTRANRAPKPLPSVALAPVEGAPGDGAISLGRAVELALRAERVPLVASGTGALVVLPRVFVAPAGTGNQTVRLTWVLQTADGTEIGKVAQENIIEAGQLDGPWGAIALAIADGAALGIADLVRAYRDAVLAGLINPTQ